MSTFSLSVSPCLPRDDLIVIVTLVLRHGRETNTTVFALESLFNIYCASSKIAVLKKEVLEEQNDPNSESHDDESQKGSRIFLKVQ